MLDFIKKTIETVSILAFLALITFGVLVWTGEAERMKELGFEGILEEMQGTPVVYGGGRR